MTFLELVESLHNEAKLPGDAPTAVTSQTGRAADLVRWIVEAYNDIQREKDGKWKWLRRDFTLDTVNGTASYAYTSATDVLASAAIDRFRSWDLDDRDPPHIYKVSEGEATEVEIWPIDWRDFRRVYGRATHTSARPSCLSVDVRNLLHLGPTPDGIYRVSGSYWRSNQTLAAEEDDDNADEPEMPADYHMMIVYRAITKYAYNVVAHEILARAQFDGAAMWEALLLNQGYDRFSMSTAGALA